MKEHILTILKDTTLSDEQRKTRIEAIVALLPEDAFMKLVQELTPQEKHAY